MNPLAACTRAWPNAQAVVRLAEIRHDVNASFCARCHNVRTKSCIITIPPPPRRHLENIFLFVWTSVFCIYISRSVTLRLYEELKEKYPEIANELPSPPKPGKMDIEQVRDSLYFFS